mmetsp:Transcript_7304/g.17320  ORF Transcript_7304/g.17320 Transcript_7304/m.17320 type:complete len:275 (-) Transcript_7304:6-830(-)
MAAQDPQSSQPQEWRTYFVFAVLACIGYFYGSDGAFSGLLTAGALVQLLSQVLLLVRVRSSGKVGGVSTKTLHLQVVGYVLRLSATLRFRGYTPMDYSGRYLYQCVEVLCLLTVLATLFVMHSGKYFPKASADDESYWPAGKVVMAALVIGFFMRPRLNNRVVADSCWCMGLWADTFSCLPQILLLSKRGSVDGLTAHSMATGFVAKCLAAYFWLSVYDELGLRVSWNYPGYAIVIAFVAQMIVSVDFMFAYVKNIRKHASSLSAEVQLGIYDF